MPDSNVDLIRQGFEALNERGVEALLPFIHPEFEVTTPPGLAAEPDTYRGPEGIRRYFDEFYEAMDRVTFDARDFIAVGELVVVPMILRARGRTTGIVAEQEVVQVWKLRGEQAIRVEVFATLDEAMATVGDGGT
ncbi:MAG TPA: nuclear transport factor 2 family protein [Solirubrobacterales bacterium]